MMFKIGAVLNFMLAAGHLACLFFLNEAFEFYGINTDMDLLTKQSGITFPYIITVLIAITFVICGLYALSASGVIRKLPLLSMGIYTIATVFLLRGGWGIVMMITNSFCFVEMASTTVSVIIGGIYLAGEILKGQKR